ncbi:MAG: hypothetical protein IT443_10925 [Phycisphaeraceae bacterium]|nr:hypothetical protein [Phycisphaeraceae bacterium]
MSKDRTNRWNGLLFVMIFGVWAGGCAAPARQPTTRQERLTAMANQPLPHGMTRIVVERYELASDDQETVQLFLDLKDPLAPDPAAAMREPGVKFFPAQKQLPAKLKAQSYSSRLKRVAEQSVLITRGGMADFNVTRFGPGGQRVQWVWKEKSDVQLQETNMSSSGFRLAVLDIQDQAIELEWIPYFVNVSGGEETVASMHTRLTLEPDRPYVVMAGQAVEESSVVASYFSRWRSNRRISTVLVLTAQVNPKSD